MTASDAVLPREREAPGVAPLPPATARRSGDGGGSVAPEAAPSWPAERMAALGKLLRTTAFKLTLVYLTVFALFAASLLG